MTVDYYELLGVERDADAEEIASAFRRQAARHHPDVSDDPDAEERFKRLKHAKEVLTDEERRSDYDRLGHKRFVRREREGEAGVGGSSPRRWPGGSAGHGDPFRQGFGTAAGPWHLGSLIDRFFGGAGGHPFGRARSTGPRTRTRRRRQGDDRHTTVQIDLAEAFHGAEKQVAITREEACQRCDGAGHISESEPATCPKCVGQGTIVHLRDTGAGRSRRIERCAYCDGEGELPGELCRTCDGDGRVERQVTIDIAVPPGVESGQTLRIGGAGDLAAGEADRGDLLAEVEIDDHPTITRDEADLHTDLAVSFPQAVFGDTVDVPRFEDTVELDVPAGTQSGETFRLPSAGMPGSETADRGDLYVRIQVVTPEELSADQRDSLRHFERLSESEGTS